jgi:hypothetical protein
MSDVWFEGTFASAFRDRGVTRSWSIRNMSGGHVIVASEVFWIAFVLLGVAGAVAVLDQLLP